MCIRSLIILWCNEMSFSFPFPCVFRVGLLLSQRYTIFKDVNIMRNVNLETKIVLKDFDFFYIYLESSVVFKEFWIFFIYLGTIFVFKELWNFFLYIWRRFLSPKLWRRMSSLIFRTICQQSSPKFFKDAVLEDDS